LIRTIGLERTSQVSLVVRVLEVHVMGRKERGRQSEFMQALGECFAD
jgi:hypothetical protein